MRGHVLTIRTGPDHYRLGHPADPGFPDRDLANVDYQGTVTCLDRDACGGWTTCSAAFWYDVESVRTGDRATCTVAPECATDLDPDDDDVRVMHGVEHTWHYSWGWTVPYDGCTVADYDSLHDFVWDLARDHGPGVYLVADDWDDDCLADLDVVACVWPRRAACQVCGSPLDKPADRLCDGQGCVETRRALTRLVTTGRVEAGR